MQEVEIDEPLVIVELITLLVKKIKSNSKFNSLTKEHFKDTTFITNNLFDEDNIKSSITDELEGNKSFDNYIFLANFETKSIVFSDCFNNNFSVEHYIKYGGPYGDELDDIDLDAISKCKKYSNFFEVYISNMDGDFSIKTSEMSSSTRSYFLIFHLEKGDDLRGAASIKDTGLFDFISK
jgi:hypothetical protein